MENDILLEYRMLRAEEVNRELFRDFIRHQNVTKCWRKESGKWIIKDAPFMDDWTEKESACPLHGKCVSLFVGWIFCGKRAILFYVVLYNRMMAYVEHHAYPNSDNEERDEK